MSQIKKMKDRLINESIMTETELENIMFNEGCTPLEDDQDNAHDNVLKFTNGKAQIWVSIIKDESGYITVSDVKYVTKARGTTKVDPFHTFEDLKKVLDYFEKNGLYQHWLCAQLMVSLGRRVGDTLSLKWEDLFDVRGCYKKRLDKFIEDKTEKSLGVRINDYAKTCVDKYIKLTGIEPREHYYDNIFKYKANTFRKAVKDAVDYAQLDYPVSTHSFRKFYGNMMYKLHPSDADRLSVIQMMFGHSDPLITKNYIGAIDEKIDQYNEDYSKYLCDATDGKDISICKSPLVSIKHDDLRNIITKAYTLGLSNGKENNTTPEMSMNALNDLLKEIEKVSII